MSMFAHGSDKVSATSNIHRRDSSPTKEAVVFFRDSFLFSGNILTFAHKCYIIMKTFREMLNKELKDPEFKREYDALEPEFAMIQAMLSSGMSREEIAEIAEKAEITNSRKKITASLVKNELRRWMFDVAGTSSDLIVSLDYRVQGLAPVFFTQSTIFCSI